jgi:hypothetical protein
MKANYVSFSAVIFLAASLSLAGQTKPPDSTIQNPTAFKLGQVWTMGDGVVVTVLAIEDVRKFGRVVHVRLDNVPWQSCGDFHLKRTIEHIAVTEKMLANSGLALSKENADLPQSSIEAYRKWQGQKKHEIVKAPLPILIQAQGSAPGPMICNFVPSQT